LTLPVFLFAVVVGFVSVLFVALLRFFDDMSFGRGHIFCMPWQSAFDLAQNSSSIGRCELQQ